MDPDGDHDGWWRRALQDAGFKPEAAALILTTTATPEGREAHYFAPGAVPSDAPLPLTASERATLHAACDRHRVAIYGGIEQRLQLGHMRWCLEWARQYDLSPATITFADAILASLQGLFGGRGSAVVWHCIPTIDDADLAAGHLVSSVLGPQIGDLGGPSGALFRADRPRGVLETLPQRLVVFAAIHAETFDDSLLASFSPSDESWWKALLEDGDFTHLRLSSKYYVPEADAIEELMPGNPADAWRRLQHHLRLCLERGMSVIKALR